MQFHAMLAQSVPRSEHVYETASLKAGLASGEAKGRRGADRSDGLALTLSIHEPVPDPNAASN